jgi:hypothetical protein
MKAQELRIGNYLKKNVVVKIDAKIIFDIWIEAEDYEPIPLTEEWLLKFGFVKEPRDSGEVAFCMSENDCNVIIQDFGDGFLFIWELSFMGKPIKYVHELQNIYFALQGEELIYNELIID